MDSTGFNNMSQEILISVIKTIKSILNIDRSDVSLDANTKLLVDIPEFDSQAVVSVVTAIEEKFDIEIDDDEIIFHLTTGSRTEMKSWVLSYGKEVEVLEPVDFREEIKNEIDEMKQIYN